MTSLHRGAGTRRWRKKHIRDAQNTPYHHPLQMQCIKQKGAAPVRGQTRPFPVALCLGFRPAPSKSMGAANTTARGTTSPTVARGTARAAI